MLSKPGNTHTHIHHYNNIMSALLLLVISKKLPQSFKADSKMISLQSADHVCFYTRITGKAWIFIMLVPPYYDNASAVLLIYCSLGAHVVASSAVSPHE